MTHKRFAAAELTTGFIAEEYPDGALIKRRDLAEIAPDASPRNIPTVCPVHPALIKRQDLAEIARGLRRRLCGAPAE